jgi:predicted ribosome quality control (RQC) complex YloA/Tae2 family protein
LGEAGESNTIRIGTQQTTTFIKGISGAVVTGAAVVVNAAGQLGTVASSERFKKDIATMQTASEAILALRPVTFHYRTDAGNTPQFGLIAEEVARVNPELVLPDKEGKPYTVRYEAVNAMLLNEFLKEHRTVQELKSVVAKQEAAAAQQQKQIESLTAGLQKVSAQLEASKPAPQVVNNP